MGGIGKVVSGVFGGDEAEDSAKEAAGISAEAQREALAYLKEREAIPQQFREAALQRLGGIYELPGGVGGGMEQLIEQARASPYFTSRRDAAEDAALRSASATGRLRSGTVPAAFAQISDRTLAEAIDKEMLGLTGLAQLPSNAQAIAQGTRDIGNTLAQGEIAGSQGQQSALGTGLSTLIGLGGLFI